MYKNWPKPLQTKRASFAKNRHLLGFDNPRKALLTTVKEAVDNSLDACEEAGILPDITVVIEDLQYGSDVQVIQTEAARLSRLLDNVLDFGRLEQNRHTHRLRSTDLVEVAGC